MKAIIIALSAMFMLSGCVNNAQLPITIDTNKHIIIKSSKLSFIDKSIIHTNKIGTFSDSEIRIPWVNDDLKKNIEKAVLSTLHTNSNEYTTVVTLTNYDIYQTLRGEKTIPLFGMLALGKDEDIVCTISLLIEVEDKQGRVIASTPVSVHTTHKSPLLTEDDVRSSHTKVIDMALSNLQGEIIRQYKRVLWEYL